MVIIWLLSGYYLTSDVLCPGKAIIATANTTGGTTATINNSLSDPSLDLRHMLRSPLSPPQGERGGFDSQVCPRMVGSEKALKCLQNVL